MIFCQKYILHKHVYNTGASKGCTALTGTRSVLIYGVFLSIVMGVLPILLVSNFTSSIDCDDAFDKRNSTMIEKNKICHEKFDPVTVSTQYIALILGIFLGVITFYNIYNGWCDKK